MKERDRGMTLVEMLVVLLISSILFFILGSILVSAYNWWLTSCAKVEAENDMQYARKRIHYLLRNATSAPFVAVGSRQVQRGEEVGHGHALKFNGNHFIRAVNGQLLYQHNGQREVLLDNVTRAVLYTAQKDDPGASDNWLYHCVAQVELQTTRTLPTGEVYISSCTIIVKNRNSGP